MKNTMQILNTNPKLAQIIQEIHAISRPELIAFYTHFFRADEGDICYGDKFLAIKVPELRKVIKKYYKELELDDLPFFISLPYNEMRFFGQQVVSYKYKQTRDLDEKKKYLDFLIAHITSINHWNLVDSIADLFGNYCLQIGDYTMLKQFANDKSIWIRRIAIVACIQLIKTKNTNLIDISLQILDNNLTQSHEYIHKAIGWILREVGKVNEAVLIDYLQTNWDKLPPVTRSYATEKLRQTRDTKILFGISKYTKTNI
jgi:3-methyladenine DNA glycosylase AlkD